MANDCLEDLSQLYLQLLALKSISYNCLCDLLDYLITNTELTYYEGKEALTRLTSQNKEKVLSEVLDFYGEVKLKITDQIARAVYSDVKNKVVCASIDFKQLDILTVLKILRNIPLIKNKIGNNNILQQCFKIIECMRTLTSHKEEFEFWEELNTQYYPQGIVYFNQLSNPPQDKDMLLIQCCNGIQEIAEYLKKNGRYNVNDYDCIVSKLENIKIYSKQDLINNYTSLIVSQLLIMEHYKSIDSTLMTLNNKTNVLKFNVEVADIINSETKEHSTFQYEDVQIGTELYNKILHLIKQTLEKNLGVKSGPDTYEVYIYEMNFKTISAPCKPMQVGVFEVKVKPGESSLNWNSLYDPISPQTTKIREKLSESIRENVVKLYNHNIKVLIKKWDIGSLIIHFSLSRHNNENLYLDKDLRSNIINIITIAVKNIFPNEEVEMARLLPSYITLPNVLDIGCSTLVNDYSLTKVILEWTSNRSNLNIQLEENEGEISNSKVSNILRETDLIKEVDVIDTVQCDKRPKVPWHCFSGFRSRPEISEGFGESGKRIKLTETLSNAMSSQHQGESGFEQILASDEITSKNEDDFLTAIDRVYTDDISSDSSKVYFGNQL